MDGPLAEIWALASFVNFYTWWFHENVDRINYLVQWDQTWIKICEKERWFSDGSWTRLLGRQKVSCKQKQAETNVFSTEINFGLAKWQQETQPKSSCLNPSVSYLYLWYVQLTYLGSQKILKSKYHDKKLYYYSIYNIIFEAFIT